MANYTAPSGSSFTWTPLTDPTLFRQDPAYWDLSQVSPLWVITAATARYQVDAGDRELPGALAIAQAVVGDTYGVPTSGNLDVDTNDGRVFSTVDLSVPWSSGALSWITGEIGEANATPGNVGLTLTGDGFGFEALDWSIDLRLLGLDLTYTGPSGSCQLTFVVRSACSSGGLAGAGVALENGVSGVTSGGGAWVTPYGTPCSGNNWTVTLAGYAPVSGTVQCPCSGSATVNVYVTPTSGCPAGDGLFLIDIGLVEDGDGIAPSGSTTCDETPSFTLAVTGAGNLYEWEVWNAPGSGTTLVASGATVGTTLRVPALASAGYVIYARGVTPDGSRSVWYHAAFTRRDCGAEEGAGAVGLPGTAASLELRDPDERATPRYLPRWLSLYGTATAPPSAALFWQFWQPYLRQLRQLARRRDQLLDEVGLLATPVGLPRQAWHLPSAYREHEDLRVTALVSGTTWYLRRVRNLREFFAADDPSFLVAANGHLFFRNLALRDVTVTPDGASGTATYTLPFEGLGLVPDADVLLDHQAIGYRLKAGAEGIEPYRSRLRLTPELSGSLRVRYQSRTLVDAVTVSVSGEPYRAPGRFDLWNRFDELGLPFGLSRRPNEDNRRFRERLYHRALGTRGDAARPVAGQIAGELALVRVLEWDGQSTLNFESSGIHGIREVEVRELPETQSYREDLVPVAGEAGVYSAARSEWQPGYLLFERGIPATRLRYPQLTQSENRVDFGACVTGAVVASYRARNYALVRSAQQFITQLLPVSGNVRSQRYQVVLTRNTRARVPTERDFYEELLIGADGVPTEFFRALRLRLVGGSPVQLAQARWGRAAHWAETEPQLEHLHAVFDLHEGAL